VECANVLFRVFAPSAPVCGGQMAGALCFAVGAGIETAAQGAKR
jgi:hypothetical protein